MVHHSQSLGKIEANRNSDGQRNRIETKVQKCFETAREKIEIDRKQKTWCWKKRKNEKEIMKFLIHEILFPFCFNKVNFISKTQSHSRKT